MQHTKEVLIGITLTVAIAVIVGAVVGGSTISQAQTESLEIIQAELKKGTNGNALLSVTIKNSGNSAITGLNGTIFSDGVRLMDDVSFDFTSNILSPGGVVSHTGSVAGTANVIIGESLTLSAGGSIGSERIEDTAVVIASRF